jgi:Fe-S-cluster containining protein
MDGATEVDLEALCRACGLCCDGSLFGRVGLTPEEVAPARMRSLRVVPSGKAFEQPCAALVTSGAGTESATACSIYDERPLACRRFTCRLRERYRREGGPIEERLSVVRRARQLLATLESSGLAPADLQELARSMENDFARG